MKATHAISLTRISEEFDIPRERVVTANPGSRVKIGDREPSFHRPPTFDSPGTLAVFDHSDGTLYSSDSFGTVVEEMSQDFTDLEEAEFFHGFDVLNRAIAPWTALADEGKFLGSVREPAALRPAWLLSTHGPTVREDAVPRLFEAIARIPSPPAWLPGADLDLEAELDAHEPPTG